MLALPAPSATLRGVNSHFNLRKPLRVRALASKKGQTSADPTSNCGFRSRQRHSQTVCTDSSSENVKDTPKQRKLKSKLEKAALFSFAPLAVALPACFGYGGHDGSGNGGGGGGDGDGSGGSGHGDGSGTNVIADIAEEEDDEDDDDDEEEEEDDEGDEEDEEEEEEEEEEAPRSRSKSRSKREAEVSQEEDDDFDDDDEHMTEDGEFKCSTVVADGLPKGAGIPTEDELFAPLHCQPNFPCSRAELSQDLKTLLQTGLFENVDVKVIPSRKNNKYVVRFIFREKVWPELQSFKVAPSGASPSIFVPSTQHGPK